MSLNVIFRYFRRQITFSNIYRVWLFHGCVTVTVANVEPLPSLATETRTIPDTGVVQMAVYLIHGHKAFPIQRF